MLRVRAPARFVAPVRAAQSSNRQSASVAVSALSIMRLQPSAWLSNPAQHRRSFAAQSSLAILGEAQPIAPSWQVAQLVGPGRTGLGKDSHRSRMGA